MKLTNRLVVSLGALGCCLLGGCGAPELGGGAGTTSTEAALSEANRHTPNPALFAKDAHPYGRSMEYWVEQWWRWVYSVPADSNPFLHPGLDSNQGQSGPVVFLVPGDRTNTIPRHKAIAVTPSTLSNDFPCPDPTFAPAPGQSLFDFLTLGTTPVNDLVVSVDATLDGVVLTDLLTYRAASDDLAYLVGDLSLQSTLDSCITGTRQPFVADAFMFIIKPLPVGMHVLTTRVVNQAGHVFVHTQNLDVQ